MISKNTFSRALTIGLGIALVCDAGFAESPELCSGGSELELMNFFAFRVTEDAIEAFHDSNLSRFAYRLGYTEKDDVKFLTKKLARAGLREMPQVTYENGMTVFKSGEVVATLEIKDLAAQKILVNGQAFQFQRGRDLKDTFDLNWSPFMKLVESSEAPSAQNVIIPEAQANFLGAALGIGLLGIPLVLSIGKRCDLWKGSKNFLHRAGNLGRAIFWEGPQTLFKDGVKGSLRVVGDASKNLYTGQESDH